MGRFLRKIALFSLFPLGTLLLIELTIHMSKEIIFNEENLENKFGQEANDYAWMGRIESDSLDIIAGSSSTKYGLSCTELNRLNNQSMGYINLAMDARDPIQTYFLLKNLNLEKVRNVYFSLDPWIYSKRYYRLRDKYLYLDFSFRECFAYLKEHDRSAFLKRYSSFFAYLFYASTPEVPQNLTIPKDFGSVALRRTDVRFDDVGDWFQTEAYGWSELQFDYLAKMEELLESRGVNFSLFVPPKRSDYSDYYIDNLIATHKEFTEKLDGNGIHSSIFGQFDLLEKHGDSALFAEAYHLNAKGQLEFSRIFNALSKKSHAPFAKDYSWFTYHYGLDEAHKEHP